MSINPFNKDRMRLIDIKRGISLITQACLIRRQHRQRASLLSRLKARIVARENPQPPGAFSYDLGDDMHPDDLLSKRVIFCDSCDKPADTPMDSGEGVTRCVKCAVEKYKKDYPLTWNLTVNTHPGAVIDPKS